MALSEEQRKTIQQDAYHNTAATLGHGDTSKAQTIATVESQAPARAHYHNELRGIWNNKGQDGK